MMERGEGGESHCNHTWGDVLTDGLCVRIPGSGQPAELPHSAGNPPEQLSSFPAGIQLSPQGSSQHRAVPLNNRENIILPLWNVVIHPGSEPVILHVQSRQPACQSWAQSPGSGKARAAGAQSGCTVFVYSWPSRGAETDQVPTQTGDSFGLI